MGCVAATVENSVVPSLVTPYGRVRCILDGISSSLSIHTGYGFSRITNKNNVSHGVVGTDYGSFTYTNLPRSTLWARTPSPFGSLCAL